MMHATVSIDEQYGPEEDSQEAQERYDRRRVLSSLKFEDVQAIVLDWLQYECDDFNDYIGDMIGEADTRPWMDEATSRRLGNAIAARAAQAMDELATQRLMGGRR